MKNPFITFLCLIQLFTLNALAQKAKKPCHYEEKMQKQGLVDIQKLDASLLVLLKYSTTDNFMKKDVYDCITHCFMQKKAAEMLVKAHAMLKKKHPNYRLLVYDGGRPASIQKILWHTLTQYPPKERQKYVANPAEGSIHNYGCAVDLTVATAQGVPLDMGTPYDYFGELAYPKYEKRFLKQGKLTAKQVANRQILRSVMQQAGFMPIDFEWWHFNAISRKQAKNRYKIIQ